MRDVGFPLLTFIIFTPLAGAVLVAVLPRRRPEIVRAVGYVATAAELGFVGYLLYSFDTSASGYQFVENHPWIDTLGVRYVVGVDGISLFMVALTALLFPIGLLASQTISERLKSYTMWMLVLESALLGVFLSLDLILFFVFFEIVLVPMYSSGC
jgi:NADH-quinone oxidoreductase subunit M